MLTGRIRLLIIQAAIVFNPLTSGKANISWSSKYLSEGSRKSEQWKEQQRKLYFLLQEDYAIYNDL